MFWENTYEYTDIMKEAPSIEELEKSMKFKYENGKLKNIKW